MALKRLFPNHHSQELRYTFITGTGNIYGINYAPIVLRAKLSFDKDVKTSVIDRGYTDYSEKYALAEAEQFNYEL